MDERSAGRQGTALSAAFEPLEPGALIWIEFDPVVGREQSGWRPALVVSPVEFHQASGFTMVCPITSRVRPFPSSVVLDAGLEVAGEILTSHLRSVDTLERKIRRTGQLVPPDVLEDVRARLAGLLGIRF